MLLLFFLLLISSWELLMPKLPVKYVIHVIRLFWAVFLHKCWVFKFYFLWKFCKKLRDLPFLFFVWSCSKIGWRFNSNRNWKIKYNISPRTKTTNLNILETRLFITKSSTFLVSIEVKKFQCERYILFFSM